MSKRILGFGIAAIILAGLAALTGCQHYALTVRLDADGGGHRESRLDGPSVQVTELESDVEQNCRIAFSLGPDWQRIPLEEGDSQLQFTRAREVEKIEGWPAVAEIHVPGDPERPDGPVLLSNSIEVFQGSQNDSLTLSYRETFRWDGLLPAVGEIVANLLVTELAREYPDLGAVERAKLKGLVAGAAHRHLSLELGDAEDAEYEYFLDVLGTQLTAVIRKRYPRVEDSTIREFVEQAYRGESKEADELLDRELPSLSDLFATDLKLRVTMPGPIIDSNAEEISGNTASWSIDFNDAILQPVEAYVRSTVEE
jgi:hypothetical protein